MLSDDFAAHRGVSLRSFDRRHNCRLPLELDAVADGHLSATTSIDLSVDLDFSGLDRHFGLPAGIDPAEDLQELVEGEFLGSVGIGIVWHRSFFKWWMRSIDSV